MRKIIGPTIIGLLCLAGPARADVLTFGAILDGPSEAPPNTSPGVGKAVVYWDDVLNTMRVKAEFSGLVPTTAAGAPSGVTASHIHCCTADPWTGTIGVATTTPTFPGFPSGVQAGSYDHTFDLLDSSSFRPGFITASGGTPANAAAFLLAGIQEGRAYFNIHTNAFPAGEIRGFLVPVPVPEPTVMLLLGTGFLGLAARRRMRG